MRGEHLVPGPCPSPDVAEHFRIGIELVAAPYRSGGQAQYVPRSVPEPLGERFAATPEWALRALLERDSKLDVVAVNDLTEPAALARLLTFDSTAGRLGRPVTADGAALVIDGRRIAVLAEREPTKLPWAELGVDVVLEATGRFTSAAAARAHLAAGAKKVLVGAPSDGADVTLAFGVNNDAYDPAAHTIVSNASCTTNALAPLAAVLDELTGIEHGFIRQQVGLLEPGHRHARTARRAPLR